MFLDGSEVLVESCELSGFPGTGASVGFSNCSIFLGSFFAFRLFLVVLLGACGRVGGSGKGRPDFGGGDSAFFGFDNNSRDLIGILWWSDLPVLTNLLAC